MLLLLPCALSTLSSLVPTGVDSADRWKGWAWGSRGRGDVIEKGTLSLTLSLLSKLRVMIID